MYTSAEIYNNQHLEDRVSGTDGLCSVYRRSGKKWELQFVPLYIRGGLALCRSVITRNIRSKHFKLQPDKVRKGFVLLDRQNNKCQRALKQRQKIRTSHKMVSPSTHKHGML